MAKKGLAHPTALLAVAGTLVALAPLAQASAASAATNQYAFSANAFGSQAVASVGGLNVGSGRSAYVTLGCTTRPQTQTNHTAGVSISGLSTSVGAVTDTLTTAHNTSTGTYSDTATSSVASISALGGLVKATAIKATASAAEGTGGATASGSVTLTGLTIAGNSIAVHPAANTKVNVANVGTVTLNAQKTIKTSGRALTSVDAIQIVLAAGNSLGLPTGATITIGHALATVSGPVSGLLSGLSFGTSLTGNPNVNSGPTFAAYVNCTGTGGTTITNKGASVSAGPLSAGAVTDTATGTDTATQLSAKTTSKVTNVSLSGLVTLSVTAINASASAGVTGGKLTDSGSVTIIGLKVGGVTVSLPPVIPANYKVTLGLVTLTLNRQVVGKSGLQVQGLTLTVAGVGTITVASASAYA